MTLSDWPRSLGCDALSKNKPMKMRDWLFFDGINSNDSK